MSPAADSLCSCSTGGRDTVGNSDGDGDGNCRGSDTHDGNIVL